MCLRVPQNCRFVIQELFQRVDDNMLGRMGSAGGGNRTHTVTKDHGILSPARLPVPSLRLMLNLKTSFFRVKSSIFPDNHILSRAGCQALTNLDFNRKTEITAIIEEILSESSSEPDYYFILG